MTPSRRPTFFILCAMLAVPLLFQNCSESFTLGEGLNLQGTGNGGNGGGYDGKPGTYILADLGGECATGAPAGSVKVKQAIVVDEAGQMSLTVRDCEALPVAEPVVPSDISVNAKSVSAFVLRGRFYQKAEVSSGLSVFRKDVSQYFCSWTQDGDRRGEFLLKEVSAPISERSEVATESSSLLASIFEEAGESRVGTVSTVAALDNTPVPTSSEIPDPYLDGLPRVFESKANESLEFNVMALFFADKAAQAVNISIKGQTQSGSRCWMSY
jgi:hypothetical protein